MIHRWEPLRRLDRSLESSRGGQFTVDRNMSINIEMPAQEVAAIKQLTRLDNDAEAIVKAAREFVRLVSLRELKAASGKVDFDANWQEFEDLEVAESSLPQ